MSLYILVRHGPAPEETEDETGALNCTFPGHFMVELGGDQVVALFGTKGDEKPQAFIDLVKTIWGVVKKPESEGGKGHGHMLIGVCTGLEFDTPTTPSCGFGQNAEEAKLLFAPTNYVPLYAVARKLPKDGEGYDLAVDYRQSTGKKDLAPFLFPPA